MGKVEGNVLGEHEFKVKVEKKMEFTEESIE
jgi:hypothetical protein